MKIWAILVIFLITFIGTFIPCCPASGCEAEISVKLNGDADAPADEPCPSFFACAGCTGFIIASRNVDLMPPLPQQKMYNVYRPVAGLSNFSSLCWQPPRALLI